jgi:hypothetical protein
MIEHLPLCALGDHARASHDAGAAGLRRRGAAGLSLRRAIFAIAGFALASALSATPAAADRIKHSIAVFAGLDKITGRIISFEVAANETVQFGSLQITERACYTRPPTETPQTTSFLDVDEIDAANTYKKIFSGWMFASSPGLHALEHPVYDVWLVDCKGTSELIASPPDTAAVEPQPEVTKPPPQQQPKPTKPKRKPDSEELLGEAPGRNNPIDVPPPPGFNNPQDRRPPSQRFFPTTNPQ